jgi:hypothetical protein
MAEIIVPQKRCCTCKLTKTHADFGSNRNTPDGLAFRCKECDRIIKERSRERRRAEDSGVLCKECNGPTMADSPSRRRIFCSNKCTRKAASKIAAIKRVSLFWSRVDITDTCWLWTGWADIDGYGAMAFGHNKSIRVHRYSYMLQFGEIPKGLSVCHRCDVRNCVRPDHLFLGTSADNNRDMALKGRSASGERHISRLRPELTLRGERHPMAKLNKEDVDYIRSQPRGGKALADRFGISYGHLKRIRRGILWN